MGKHVPVAVAFTAAGLLALTPSPGTAASDATPLWVRHVQNYPGGISEGVRATLDAGAIRAETAHPLAGGGSPARASGTNLQINSRDSRPPVPQNETAVAASLDDPNVAVAAANDYVTRGVAVMRTLDGGRSWQTTYVVPQFAGTADVCSGGDPSVAYSRRDHVFVLSSLCFFRTLPYSELQIFVSTDNGLHWTSGHTSARAATNYDYDSQSVDTSVFYDKEYIAVDNTPSSAHYGRLYVTYTKFHMQLNGFADYCPIELSYTDRIDLTNPALTTFTQTKVQPTNPGGDGTGLSANQFSVPVVEPDGTLDVGFVQADCDFPRYPHLLFQRSTDGGATFLKHAVRIDKPGQYATNPGETLPPTSFRAPNTPSIVYDSGVLTYVYQNSIDRKRSGANISVQQSRDGGRHWSDMRWLSTDGGKPAANDQFFPWIAGSGSGDLFAIWLDRRLDPQNRDINTWEAVSHNNGRTWTQRRISTASWNPDQGFFDSGAFIGDYIGIAVSRTRVYPVWTDGRNSAFARTGIGETDIFTDLESR